MAESKDDEIKRLREALIFARARIVLDIKILADIVAIFPTVPRGMIEFQNKVDQDAFAIIDQALKPVQ